MEISDTLIKIMSQFADQLNDRNSEIFILTWEAVKNHVLKEDFDLPAIVQINGFIEIIQNEPFQGHWEFDAPCTKFLPGLMTCFYVPDQDGSQKVQINIFYEIHSISTIPTTTLTSTAPVIPTSQTMTTLSTTRPTTTSQTTTTTSPVSVTTKPSTTAQTTTTKKPKPTKQPICE